MVCLTHLMFLVFQDTIVAIRVGGDKLSIANVEKDKYPVVEFSTDPAQARSSNNGSSPINSSTSSSASRLTFLELIINAQRWCLRQTCRN